MHPVSLLLTAGPQSSARGPVELQSSVSISSLGTLRDEDHPLTIPPDMRELRSRPLLRLIFKGSGSDIPLLV